MLKVAYGCKANNRKIALEDLETTTTLQRVDPRHGERADSLTGASFIEFG
jgi:hypothetical protein